MKSAAKFIVIICVTLVGAVLVLYIFRGAWWSSKKERAAERMLQDIATQYQADAYGGASPEETLRLFIDALNKGDTDLASRFFAIEKQAEWRTALNNWKENNKLAGIVSILNQAGHGREVARGIYQMAVTNDALEALFLIDFVKNEATQKWKLERF